MEFKKLEIEDRQSWYRKLIGSAWLRRTLIFVILGAAGGFVFYYFTEGRASEIMSAGGILEHVLIGAFVGFFLTNSPCARGRC